MVHLLGLALDVVRTVPRISDNQVVCTIVLNAAIRQPSVALSRIFMQSKGANARSRMQALPRTDSSWHFEIAG